MLTLIFVIKIVVFTTASMEDPRPARVAFRLSIACIVNLTLAKSSK